MALRPARPRRFCRARSRAPARVLPRATRGPNRGRLPGDAPRTLLPSARVAAGASGPGTRPGAAPGGTLVRCDCCAAPPPPPAQRPHARARRLVPDPLPLLSAPLASGLAAVVPPTLPGSRPMRCDSASFGPFSPPIQRFLGDAAWRRRGSSIGHGGLDRLSDAGGVLHLEGAHSAAAGATIPLESADSDLLRDLAVRQTAQIAALREQLRHRSDLRRYTTVYMGATAPAFLVPTDTSDGADRALRRLRASVEHVMGPDVRLYRLGPSGRWAPLDDPSEAASLCSDKRRRVIAARPIDPLPPAGAAGSGLAGRASGAFRLLGRDDDGGAAVAPAAAAVAPAAADATAAADAASGGAESWAARTPSKPARGPTAPTPSANVALPLASNADAPASVPRPAPPGVAFVSPAAAVAALSAPSSAASSSSVSAVSASSSPALVSSRGALLRPRPSTSPGSGVRRIQAPGGDTYSAELSVHVRVLADAACDDPPQWRLVSVPLGESFHSAGAASRAIDRALLCVNAAANAAVAAAERRAVEAISANAPSAAAAAAAVERASASLLLPPDEPPLPALRWRETVVDQRVMDGRLLALLGLPEEDALPARDGVSPASGETAADAGAAAADARPSQGEGGGAHGGAHGGAGRANKDPLARAEAPGGSPADASPAAAAASPAAASGRAEEGEAAPSAAPAPAPPSGRRRAPSPADSMALRASSPAPCMDGSRPTWEYAQRGRRAANRVAE
ncbi:unnamed protein product, partial [Symbiodinium sp. KB8]